jgi:uncharacterized protein (DUF1778 family)
MSANLTSDVRFDVIVPEYDGHLIEQAASVLGQSVSDFVAAALISTAKQVVATCEPTVLNARDWRRFLEIVNDDQAEPNAALTAAADEYKKHFGNIVAD